MGFQLTGNLESLNVLKDNIEEVTLYSCPKVTGNFIILADFPRLKRLDLNGTAVTGDIRDIGDNDSHLDYLLLPDTVFGGQYHQFQSISEVPSFMDSASPILRRFSNRDWCWLLLEESPDWYEFDYFDLHEPGSRVGWRWGNEGSCFIAAAFCEINWLDPEPQKGIALVPMKNMKCTHRGIEIS